MKRIIIYTNQNNVMRTAVNPGNQADHAQNISPDSQQKTREKEARYNIGKAVLCLMAFLISGVLTAQVTQQFTNSGTFTVPSGVSTLSVYIFGGGGGGG